MGMERLFEIVYLLMDKQSLTAKELAGHFGVSPRTILRDVDALSAAGIPIYTLQGKGGGIALMEGYVLNKSLLTKEQQQEVLFALKALTAVKGLEGEETFEKLKGLFSAQNTDWVEVDFSPWGSGPKEKEKWQMIKQAVLLKRQLTFEYFNSYGQKTYRVVEPVRVVYKAHSWYMQGFCTRKNDWRIYKMSRMKGLTLSEETFSRELPESLGFDEPMEGEIEYTLIRLHFSPQAAYRVYDEYEEENIDLQEDGSLIATASYPCDGWVVGHILSFGQDVKVLEPDFLREEVIRRAEEIIKNNR